MISSVTQQANNNQPAFKAVVIKNFPKKKPFGTDMLDFVAEGFPKMFKGGNKRNVDIPDNMYIVDMFNRSGGDIFRGRTREAEDLLYKDLIARKDAFPGVEIHKIDDWA